MIVDADIVQFDGISLDCGTPLAPVEVAYETWGALNEAKSNAILILHAFSGDAHAAGISPQTGKPGWWDNMIGPGKAFDTNQYFVICSNVLGGCRGTTGPSSINPETGCPYGMSLPGDHHPRHGAAAEDAHRPPGHPAAAGGHRRLDGRHAGAGMGGGLSRRGGLRHPHRHHGAALGAADRVQRGGPAGHHGGPGLERRRLLRGHAARRAASPWRAWSATSPT